MSSSAPSIRRAGDADVDAIVGVAAAALGWAPGEPHAELFSWKHLDNPFGRSPMWVAEVDGTVAGFRTFLRWELVDRDGRVHRCVRAVDTATHPDFQRRGIFSALARAAIADLVADGDDFVFNTPNEQSRPGYLKLGWVDVGRPAVAVRPRSPRALVNMFRARTAADKWSEPSTVGRAADEAFADPDLHELLTSQPSAPGLATHRSAEFLAWRHRLPALHYRVFAPDGVADGLVAFRLRRRGRAIEGSISTVLAPGGDTARVRQLLRSLGRAVPADYLLRTGSPDLASRFLPLPGQGPRLTVRELASKPPTDINAWSFELGDLELF